VVHAIPVVEHTHAWLWYSILGVAIDLEFDRQHMLECCNPPPPALILTVRVVTGLQT